MPEPALNRRERYTRVHPPRASFAPEIVEVQVENLGARACQARRLNCPHALAQFVAKDVERAGEASRGSTSNVALSASLRISSTARRRVEIGTRRARPVFVLSGWQPHFGLRPKLHLVPLQRQQLALPKARLERCFDPATLLRARIA